MIEFSVSSQTAGFSATLFIANKVWLPETGLILRYNGQELGRRISWLVTLQVLTGLSLDNPVISDVRYDPNLDPLTILEAWEADDQADDPVAKLLRANKGGVFDHYCLLSYQWVDKTVIVAARWAENDSPTFLMPMKWVIPTSTFRQVLLPLCHINSFILEQSGKRWLNWDSFSDQLRDFEPISEPLLFECRDDLSGFSVKVDYLANHGAWAPELFLAGKRLPSFSTIDGSICDLACLSDGGVYRIDPKLHGDLDPTQPPEQLLSRLMFHSDASVRNGVALDLGPDFAQLEVRVYGWRQQTVIVFAKKPFTDESSSYVWAIPNDDFQFMLKCAIDLFGTPANLFQAQTTSD